MVYDKSNVKSSVINLVSSVCYVCAIYIYTIVRRLIKGAACSRIHLLLDCREYIAE